MTTQEIDRIARRRAGAKLGFYIHATIYVLVNMMLMGLAAMAGKHWAVFPLMGWGLGLAIHGAVVFIVNGGGLHDRMVQHERNRLAMQRDPW
jgi:hypothetical protein